MKNLIIIAAIALALGGCRPEVKNPQPAPTEITSDTVVRLQSHSARNSLDYIGIYKGKLPCADCAGIEVSLQLSEEFNYTLTTKYLGKTTKSIERKGNFSWNKAGNAIVLENVKDEPNQYFVGENSLTQLDLTGNKITGKLADSYVLHKLPEAQAAKTDAAAGEMPPLSLGGTRWKLSELNGNKIKRENSEKPYSIQFGNDGSFGAYAGCNNIGGKYDSKADKIRIYNVISTRMACSEMDVETHLLKAVETVDNFVGNNTVLQLRKGNAVIAKFDAYTTQK